MALVKHNNNSLSAVTSMASLSTGAMTLIKEVTASSVASIEFIDGSSDVVLDSTYPIYLFKIINAHIISDTQKFSFNFSTDSGSNYNVAKTTTMFQAVHDEGDSFASLAYDTGDDLAQGTGLQPLSGTGLGSGNDENLCAEMFLFNPSSTTFVKHYISRAVQNAAINYAYDSYSAGYGNTTSAIDAVKFQANSGNIDTATIKLYGIKDS